MLAFFPEDSLLAWEPRGAGDLMGAGPAEAAPGGGDIYPAICSWLSCAWWEVSQKVSGLLQPPPPCGAPGSQDILGATGHRLTRVPLSYSGTLAKELAQDICSAAEGPLRTTLQGKKTRVQV